jgi:hypothetical protein
MSRPNEPDPVPVLRYMDLPDHDLSPVQLRRADQNQLSMLKMMGIN